MRSKVVLDQARRSQKGPKIEATASGQHAVKRKIYARVRVVSGAAALRRLSEFRAISGMEVLVLVVGLGVGLATALVGMRTT